MATRMPPPGGSKSKPGVVIAIGMKPKDGPGDGRMSPPGAPSDGMGGKVSGEEAGLVLDSEHCIDCTMYHPDTGECDKVEGNLSPQDGCAKYFDPIQGGEPDADDQGGASDNDADDQGGGQ